MVESWVPKLLCYPCILPSTLTCRNASCFTIHNSPIHAFAGEMLPNFSDICGFQDFKSANRNGAPFSSSKFFGQHKIVTDSITGINYASSITQKDSGILETDMLK